MTGGSDFDFLVAIDDTRPVVCARAYFERKEGLQSLFGRCGDLVSESNLANLIFANVRPAKSRRFMHLDFGR